MPDPCDPSRLSDLEHVRARPALYVGDTGSPGLHHLAWEIIANSIQEVEDGWASCLFAGFQAVSWLLVGVYSGDLSGYHAPAVGL